MKMTRRKHLGLLAKSTVGGMTLWGGGVAGGETGEARASALGQEFVNQHDLPGLSLTMAVDGRIVLQRAYGHADLPAKKKLETSHRFRIASISKPMTSVAVMRLVEQGKLGLQDRVLGKGGLLERAETGGGLEKITVRQLLNHTSGGWKNDGDDPMFQDPTMDHDELIAWTLANQPLKHPPGEQYAYSNFGYCLLGRIIEKVTGQSYADCVRELVLKPCGIGGMRIGDPPGAKVRRAGEVAYHEGKKHISSSMNVARMDAHGGWVGTPTELVKFGLRVDGFDPPKDILTPASRALMVEREGVNEGYALGWKTNERGHYWHGGSLPGLASLLVRTSGHACWAACVNTRKKGLSLELDRLMWRIYGALQAK
jgi:CubicO group peptidase (beta-lactamase class C family)